jgi:diphthine-ammonia ligase
MSYIASWSGGKDSCLACYKAMLSGYDIRYLVNFVSKEYGRVSFHGTETRLIQLQAESIGTRLCQKETTKDCYEQEFKEAVRSLIPDGIEGMIFGDIYTQEHRDWTERVCSEVGIEAVEPLWGRDTEDVLSEFIGAGFQAVIIGAQSRVIDAEWIGRRVDRDFIEYLKNKNICPCGENGEYHTLVTDGPIFDKGIEIVQARTIARDNYWFLDTCEYKLV